MSQKADNNKILPTNCFDADEVPSNVSVLSIYYK